MGAVYLGEAEAPGVRGQWQQTVKGLSPERESKVTLMAPESMEGRHGEPEVQLIIGSFCPCWMRCPGWEGNTGHKRGVQAEVQLTGGSEHQGKFHSVTCPTCPDPEKAEYLSRDRGFLLGVSASCHRRRCISKRTRGDLPFFLVKRNHFAIHLLTPLSFLFRGQWRHQ